MSDEMTEAELIERLRDGCGFASDACASICRSLMFSVPVEVKDYQTLLGMLRQASGAAGALAHVMENPLFLDIRNCLENLRDSAVSALKLRNEACGLFFAKAGDALGAVSRQADRIFSHRRMARQEVLRRLNERKVVVH